MCMDASTHKQAGMIDALGRRAIPLVEKLFAGGSKLIDKDRVVLPALQGISAIGSKDVVNAGTSALKNQARNMGMLVGGGAVGNPAIQKLYSLYTGQKFDQNDAVNAAFSGAGYGALGAAGLGGAKFLGGAAGQTAARFNAIRDIGRIGVLPESVMKAGRGLESLRANLLAGTRPEAGWGNTFKNLFGGSNRSAVVNYLTNAEAGKGVMGPHLLSRLKTLGMNTLDSGTVLNTNVLRSLNSPKIQKAIADAGIKTIRGSTVSGGVRTFSQQELGKLEDVLIRRFGKNYAQTLKGVFGPAKKDLLAEKLTNLEMRVSAMNRKQLAKFTGMSDHEMRKMKLSPSTFTDYLSMRSSNPGEKIRDLYVYGKNLKPVEFNFTPGQGGVPVQYF